MEHPQTAIHRVAGGDLGETGLPDARLPHQEGHAAAAVGRTSQRILQRGGLALPPDEARRKPWPPASVGSSTFPHGSHGPIMAKRTTTRERHTAKVADPLVATSLGFAGDDRARHVQNPAVRAGTGPTPLRPFLLIVWRWPRSSALEPGIPANIADQFARTCS